jgi:putative DNA primase/helicase
VVGVPVEHGHAQDVPSLGGVAPPTRPRAYKRTDMGNAERLRDRHGDGLRFVPGLGWHVWDGRRWLRDGDGAAMRLMKDTARSMWADISRDDGDESYELVKFVRASESKARLEAALGLASTDAALVCPADRLDSDPLLFNVANGTIDLRSGELRPHERSDLITRQSPVWYQPDARSPLWAAFLDRITGGDKELAGFLQRAVGYSLTGLTSEEKLFFAHGPAASGKSTFLEAVKAMLGEYATTADFDSFLKKQGGGVRNDIARLAGTRMVIGVEVDQGRELAEGLIKQVTGGDRIAARYLYKEFFEFTPQFTLWLAANDRPLVRAEDEGMWRRIIQVPFIQAIPEDERDPRLKGRLRGDPDHQAAILRWAVEGCLAWQEHGLGIPTVVRSYTREYRLENDPVADFLATECRIDKAARVRRAELHQAYTRYAMANSERPLSRKAFATALRRHGIAEGPKVAGQRAWHGVTIADSGLVTLAQERPVLTPVEAAPF